MLNSEIQVQWKEEDTGWVYFDSESFFLKMAWVEFGYRNNPLESLFFAKFKCVVIINFLISAHREQVSSIMPKYGTSV
jgi:hypothetical protein